MSTKNGYYSPHKKTLKTSNEMAQGKQSIFFWILSMITSFFFLWSPFQKNLFNGNSFDFERPIFTAVVWSFLILVLLSIYMFNQWNWTSRIAIISVLIWFLPLTYLLSSFDAASAYYSSNMILINCAYVSFFLLGVFLTKTEVGMKTVINIIESTGYLIVIFGLLNWFGSKELAFQLVQWFAADMPNLSYYQDAIMADHNGVRLTSTFQYANAYAAFLIALLLGTLYLTSISTRWINIVYYSVMTVPILISFWVTLSRGALVILPIIFLSIIVVMKPYKQIVLLIHTALAMVASLVVLGPITDIGVVQVKSYNGELAMQGWGYLIVASLLSTVAAVIIQRYAVPFIIKKTEKLSNFRFSNLYLPVATVVLGAFALFLVLSNNGILNILPDNIKTRVENINFQQNSVLERGTFYVDAIKLFKDFPLTGAGGGAWSAMYEKYQNNPYISRQAHNFFLQYLTETGAIGFSIFILTIIVIFWVSIRNYHQTDNPLSHLRLVFYIFACSLLIHSMIDFDLSYVNLGIVLFLSLGSMIAGDTYKLKVKWLESANRFRWAYPAVILVFSVTMFFYSTQLLSANSNFKNAMAATQAQKPVKEIFGYLDKALSINSGHPDYTGYKLDILLQLYNQTKDENYYSQANELIQQVRSTEAHNRTLLERHINIHLVKGNLDQALLLVNQDMKNFPWDINLYEKNVALNLELGNKARLENNESKKEQFWKAAFDTYNQIQERQKVLAALPKEQIQGREFGVTRSIAMPLGQIEYLRGNYSASQQFLSIGLDANTLNDVNSRMQIRWYLAALQKQGNNDQPLMDKLIATDPNERQEILNLLNAK